MDNSINLFKQAIVEGLNQKIDDVLISCEESAESSKKHNEKMKAILDGKVTGNVVWTTKMRRVVALLVAALLLLTSCAVIYRDEIYNYIIGSKSTSQYFPEGYTGGWRIPVGSNVEYYWVETYEECVASIQLLKSHGSTFAETVIFTSESEKYDVKYYFQFSSQRDKINYGENPYDRYAANVVVGSVGFYDDVTIDELVYSHVSNYNSFGFNVIEPNFVSMCMENPDMLSSLEYEWKQGGCNIRRIGDTKTLLVIGGVDEESTAADILSSIRIIDYNATGW